MHISRKKRDPFQFRIIMFENSLKTHQRIKIILTGQQSIAGKLGMYSKQNTLNRKTSRFYLYNRFQDAIALATIAPYFVTWVVKQVWGTSHSQYFRNPHTKNTVMPVSFSQVRTKCIIVSHSENGLGQRNIDRMSIVYLEFLRRKYHCCPFNTSIKVLVHRNSLTRICNAVVRRECATHIRAFFYFLNSV